MEKTTNSRQKQEKKELESLSQITKTVRNKEGWDKRGEKEEKRGIRVLKRSRCIPLDGKTKFAMLARESFFLSSHAYRVFQDLLTTKLCACHTYDESENLPFNILYYYFLLLYMCVINVQFMILTNTH